jgi:phage tail P2-like protein
MMSSPSLLPPNATQVEKNLELSQSRLSALPAPMRDLWNPDTCPVELLPWLAWAMSVDAWQPTWPESIKRASIKNSVAIQRKKGTAYAVRAAVQALGSSLILTEWFEKTPPGPPHTFEVLLSPGGSVPNTAQYQQDLINEINRTKPVRSHFTLTAGLTAMGGIGMQGIARPIIYSRLALEEA